MFNRERFVDPGYASRREIGISAGNTSFRRIITADLKFDSEHKA
jgi:hypothetical protein